MHLLNNITENRGQVITLFSNLKLIIFIILIISQWKTYTYVHVSVFVIKIINTDCDLYLYILLKYTLLRNKVANCWENEAVTQKLQR